MFEGLDLSFVIIEPILLPLLLYRLQPRILNNNDRLASFLG